MRTRTVIVGIAGAILAARVASLAAGAAMLAFSAALAPGSRGQGVLTFIVVAACVAVASASALAMVTVADSLGRRTRTTRTPPAS
ncbi:hypothetical protein SAMN05428970_3816 [Agromyces sp. CF514]|uniref:hypothetical protein n=1 Tax=Agromyces sp. CF514 TaxID=1881031 RepID=UPI0008E9B130|nr:hypothetical protein [Agromyces sp. CF514]SFR91584.1 hypothetical protein SAMN05428970_3816 [Agromyces sp. CF514]